MTMNYIGASIVFAILAGVSADVGFSYTAGALLFAALVTLGSGFISYLDGKPKASLYNPGP